jgi:fatty acid desaturase
LIALDIAIAGIKKNMMNIRHNIKAEVMGIRKQISVSHYNLELKRLASPSNIKTSFAICFDWLIILTMLYIPMVTSLWISIISLVIVGCRQRGLSNLTHDAAHGNLYSTRKINDSVANIFCALPMFETVNFYRKGHFKHHTWLGHEKNDPDAFQIFEPSQHKALPSFGAIFSKSLFKFKPFIHSLFGNLPKLNTREFLYVALWWTFTLFLASRILPIRTCLQMGALFFVSRATGFHLIRIFAELSDHVGLPVGSALLNTRNISGAGMARFLLHPHFDNYHLIHHIYPNVPHHNLKQVFDCFTKLNILTGTHDCTGYMMGQHTLTRCISGRCGIN